MHKKGNTEDSHPDLLGREHSSSDDHGDGHTAVKLGGQPTSPRFTHPVNTALGVGRKTNNTSDMSHALLLRLFLAPSFFTVHVALQYLALYSDNIGITYYLTRRLNEIDPRELRDVWGFIW